LLLPHRERLSAPSWPMRTPPPVHRDPAARWWWWSNISPGSDSATENQCPLRNTNRRRRA
jgi:hypothetical protein